MRSLHANADALAVQPVAGEPHHPAIRSIPTTLRSSRAKGRPTAQPWQQDSILDAIRLLPVDRDTDELDLLNRHGEACDRPPN